MTVARDEVLAAHLRYGAVAEPLRLRAYGQIAAKVLLQNPRPHTLKEVREGLAALTGAGKPTRQDVAEALGFLKDIKVVRVRSGRPDRYELYARARRSLESQVESRRDRLAAVLERNFPGDIPREILRSWFEDASNAFFAQYGDLWVASVAAREPLRRRQFEIPELLTPVIERHGLQDHTSNLLTGFRRFLGSDSSVDHEHLWSLGLAMFAARLVASGVRTDPITTSEIRDSTVILDTNVLLVIALETHRHASSMAALGHVLKRLSCRLVYVHATLDEYNRVVERWAEEAQKALSTFDPYVVRRSKDEYMRTAAARGCLLPHDYANFFQELRTRTKDNESVPAILRRP